jgi:hypothetical protein
MTTNDNVRTQCATALETDACDMNAQDCTLQNVTVARFRHRTNFLRSTGDLFGSHKNPLHPPQRCRDNYSVTHFLNRHLVRGGVAYGAPPLIINLRVLVVEEILHGFDGDLVAVSRTL